mmetsp:Transcript_9189/g.19991  ORF Transcript_9189/g.19991 Transcript_9189/m.19991 type:complete len:383 (-) Transcript_9189:746-1894(-)
MDTRDVPRSATCRILSGAHRQHGRIGARFRCGRNVEGLDTPSGSGSNSGEGLDTPSRQEFGDGRIDFVHALGGDGGGGRGARRGRLGLAHLDAAELGDFAQLEHEALVGLGRHVVRRLQHAPRAGALATGGHGASTVRSDRRPAGCRRRRERRVDLGVATPLASVALARRIWRAVRSLLRVGGEILALPLRLLHRLRHLARALGIRLEQLEAGGSLAAVEAEAALLKRRGAHLWQPAGDEHLGTDRGARARGCEPRHEDLHARDEGDGERSSALRVVNAPARARLLVHLHQHDDRARHARLLFRVAQLALAERRGALELRPLGPQLDPRRELADRLTSNDARPQEDVQPAREALLEPAVRQPCDRARARAVGRGEGRDDGLL